MPDLRWLDLEGAAGDLRPLAGHPRLHTVLAAHCHIEALPLQAMPALREFSAPFSDCPEAEVERLRRSGEAQPIDFIAKNVLETWMKMKVAA